jgi:hypothetical protein
MTSAPVTLGIEKSVEHVMTTGSSAKRDLQLNVTQEVVRSLREAREEAESVFV